MTEDHFPPESTNLSGDITTYPELCGECERHVISSHDHAEDCSEWRGTDDE